MLQLLAPEPELPGGTAAAMDTTISTSAGTSVEDFPLLLGDSYLRSSTHSTATRMRSRLFQVCGTKCEGHRGEGGGGGGQGGALFKASVAIRFHSSK